MGNKPNRNKGKPKKKWDQGQVKPNPHAVRAIKGMAEPQQRTVEVPNDARLMLACKECIRDNTRTKLNRLILIGQPDELVPLMNLHKALEHPQSVQEVQI